MVISDKYKYVFVELPRTGTTAISKELVENYDGKTILWKHAPLNKFLEQATPEQQAYFNSLVSGIPSIALLVYTTKLKMITVVNFPF